MAGFGNDDALRRFASGEMTASKMLRDADPLRHAFLDSEGMAAREMRTMSEANRAKKLHEETVGLTATAQLKAALDGAGTAASALELARTDYFSRQAGLARDGLASASFDYALPAGPGISGLGVLAELEQLYGMAHAQREHDQVWRAIASAGSLAGLASDLAFRSELAVARGAALYATTQARLSDAIGFEALRAELRHRHADLFPPLRAPTASEIAASVEMAMTHDLLALYPDWRTRVLGTLEGLSTPWVRDDAPDVSIAAMARFQSLVGLTTLATPGEPRLGEWLRLELGDYRDAPPPPPSVAEEPVARVGYQLERGFDPQLSELPPAIVGVMFAPIVPSDASRLEPDPEQVEAAVRRMLKKIEGDLRRLIQGRLQSLAGEEWYRRVPSKVRYELERRAAADRGNGRSSEPPLHYADFDDYRRIIESPDNWAEVFAAVFGEPVIIRETLRRISVVRNPCQHFRTVTLEDMVTLRAELVHLGRWIGANPLG